MNHLRSVKSQDQCLLAWLFRDPPASPRSSPAIKDVIDRMISGFRGHENSRDLCYINFPGWEWRNSRMFEDLFAQHGSISHVQSFESLAIMAGKKQ
jgi:hypothetical protein